MSAGLVGLGRFGGAGLANNFLTPWLAVFALATIILAWLYLKERVMRIQLQENFESMLVELKALRSKADIHEFRMERFELLWFPTVAVSAHDRMILSVSPGVPHCRKCVLPLLLERSHWTCRQCLVEHPESLGDLMVLDSVSKQALQWFQERHPGYRIPKS